MSDKMKDNKSFSRKDKNVAERLLIKDKYNVKPYDPSVHKKIIDIINDSSLSRYDKSNLKYRLDLLKKFYIISNKSSFNTEKERSLWISEHFPKAWIKQIKERDVDTSYNNEFVFSEEAKVVLILNDLLLTEINKYLDKALSYDFHKTQIDKEKVVKEILRRINLDIKYQNKGTLNIKEKIIDKEKVD